MLLKENYKTKREKMDLIYNIQDNIQDNKLIAIVSSELKQLEEKFSLLINKNSSQGDEFWYLILRKIQDYLYFDYNDHIEHISIEQLKGILKYIKWFELVWPPKINKKHNYILPKYGNPSRSPTSLNSFFIYIAEFL